MTAWRLDRPGLILAASVAALLLFKIHLMEPVATGPIFFAILQHDSAIFALMLLLCAAGSAAARWSDRDTAASRVAAVFGRLCKWACLLVLMLYAADVFAYDAFVTRLYASDMVTFSKEPTDVLTLLRSGLRGMRHHSFWKLAVVVVFAALLLRACYVFVAEPARSRMRSRFLMLAACAFALLSFVPVPGYFYSFGDKPLYENFVQRNKDFFIRANFSNAFRDQILTAPPPVETCRPGGNRRLNIILLLTESLSAYQSRFFSGVEDWTPHLDAIAKRETALTNFYANGWTSIGGLISLLTRTFPFVPEHTAFNRWGSPRLTDFLDSPRSLPRALVEQGYSTEFIAAGDLSFLGQDDWLRIIGFQKLVGGDDSRFAKQKVRGPFNSVPDQLLYAVVSEELSRMPSDRPYFVVVQTFWSHRPFTDQRGGRLDAEEPVIRETDEQIGVFCNQLMAVGFFQNGLLFVTGDHRAAEPFRKAEFERFGASAIARIPAVIVTRAVELPRLIEQDFQQRDFGASVEALVSDEYCLGPQEGSFLSSTPMPATCVMNARGDDRDLVYVKCGTAEGIVRTAGDATRFVSGAVPDEASIIQTINRTRVRRIK